MHMPVKALVALVAVVVVGGGAWYFSSQSSSAPGNTSASPQNTETTSEQTEGTLGDLLARTGSWSCTVQATHEGGGSEGTTYIANSQLRGDFTARMQGMTVQTSFIAKDGYMYTWSDMLPQGMKVKMESAGGTSGGQGMDPSTKVSYSCAPWTVDESKFALPEGTEFFEIGAQGAGGFNTTPLPR